MSKFKGLLDAAKGREPEPTQEAPEEQLHFETGPGLQRGRPRGKRSNPDMTQVTAYIRRDTHKAVKRELLEEDGEFSVLIESLLSKWLTDQR